MDAARTLADRHGLKEQVAALEAPGDRDREIALLEKREAVASLLEALAEKSADASETESLRTEVERLKGELEAAKKPQEAGPVTHRDLGPPPPTTAEAILPTLTQRLGPAKDAPDANPPKGKKG